VVRAASHRDGLLSRCDDFFASRGELQCPSRQRPEHEHIRQILFSNYQNVNGVQVPYHIQELFNGSLLLDFTASAATINTGLSDSLFAIQ
jgi:hypothetical protein